MPSSLFNKLRVVRPSQNKTVMPICATAAGTAPRSGAKFSGPVAKSGRTIVSKDGRDRTRGVACAPSQTRGTFSIGLTWARENRPPREIRPDASPFPGSYLGNRASQRHGANSVG